VKAKQDQAPQGREDIKSRKPGAAWPRDVMVSAASMIVDENLPARRICNELGIPYTTR
jgi:hypothetical protein